MRLDVLLWKVMTGRGCWKIDPWMWTQRQMESELIECMGMDIRAAHAFLRKAEARTHLFHDERKALFRASLERLRRPIPGKPPREPSWVTCWIRWRSFFPVANC